MSKAITKKELQNHNGENGKPLWVLIHNDVYDLTKFEHPGGPDALVDEHGEDRGGEFDSIHSPATKSTMHQYKIGYLVEDPVPKQNVDYKKTDGDTNSSVNNKNQQMNPAMYVMIALVAVIVLYKILS